MPARFGETVALLSGLRAVAAPAEPEGNSRGSRTGLVRPWGWVGGAGCVGQAPSAPIPVLAVLLQPLAVPVCDTPASPKRGLRVLTELFWGREKSSARRLHPEHQAGPP